MIGETHGHYHVTARVGAGGMGEVYRATDTRLKRDVAIKVLPAEVAGDPERLARFQREAELLASLSHTHIGAIHGLEEADGKPLLILELVEGVDLSERIKTGPIPADETLEIVHQIADALEEAHERGIVHRDLKPANIKLTPEGKVKVLDFGLAKAWALDPVSGGSSDLSRSPTMAYSGTHAGVILGTAAYMSPEQARGKTVDRRADIWAFGVVLWEMLTGRKLFEGDTVSDVLASVLKETPDLDALPDSTPPALRRLLTRCLEREPKNRLQWIGDARLELADALAPPPEPDARRETAGRSFRPGFALLGWPVAVAVLVVAAVVWLRPATLPVQPLARFTVALDGEHSLSFIDQPILALSPDGRTLAMTATDSETGRDKVFLRHLDRSEVLPVGGTEGAGEMFFSPDGASIAFFADGKLKRVSVNGGAAVNIAEAPNPRGGVWLPDGTILFSPEYAGGLWQVSDSGGEPEIMVDIDGEQGERTYRFPDATADGGIVLFTVGSTDSPNDYDEAFVAAYSVKTGERRQLIERANMARFASRDRIVFARAGDLFAVGFDPERLETVGEAVPVLEDVGGDPSSGAGYFTVASNGNLAWLAGAVTAADTHLTIVDEDGTAQRLPLTPRGFHQPRFSPDGSRLAFTVGEGYSGVSGDVWIYGLASENLSRLTFGGNDLYPVWTPDGRDVAYLTYTSEASILVKAADGSSAEESLTPNDSAPIFPESISTDGRTLAYTRISQTADIFLITQGEEARPFEEMASCPVFSPDGRWIAYSSPGSGTSSVFVRPVDGEGKWQVSPELGGYPRWSGDGRRLFYIDIGSPKRPLMAVNIEPGNSFRTGAPKVVLESLSGAYVTSTAPGTNWDVSPGGDSFVFVEFERRGEAAEQIEIALNWVQNLELEIR